MTELASLQTTTAELASPDRPGFWQEQFRGNHGGARVRFGDWPTFWGALKVQRFAGDYELGNWQNMQFESTAISYERTEADIERDGDRKSTRLLIPRRGRIGLEQDGRSALLRPGQMGVIDWGRRMVVAHDDDVVGWVITIPADALTLSPGGPPHLCLDTANALLATVHAMVQQLWAHRETMTPAQFLQINVAMAGLLENALDERWAPENEKLATIARDARRYIQQTSDDVHLTVDSVAQHLGVTRRQLERAMRLSQTTPYSFLLATRLTRAVRRLSDPGQHRRSISDIAYDSGFSNVSTFNKACRDRFDATPSQLRQRPRGRGPA